MTGADILVRTLLAGGIDTCFANPGTSEMHMVAALDRNSGIRPVLGLFEGVVTGAADGYARMTGKPAATLLHLGPGFANGIANIHNARKAGTPMLNIVGDHADYHLQYDAPLTSDLEGLSRCVSHWVGRADSARDVAAVTASAIQAAQGNPGHIATLLLAANAAWGDPGAQGGMPVAIAPAASVEPDMDLVRAAAGVLKRHGAAAMLMLGGTSLRSRGMCLAAAIARKVGCKLGAQSSNSRMERGGGIPAIARVPYPVDAALQFMAGTMGLVRIGAPTPVAFFAYPNKPSLLVDEGCEILDAVSAGVDPLRVVEALADLLGVRLEDSPTVPLLIPGRPTGALGHDTVAAAVAASLPEHAIVVDEAVTTGRMQTYDSCASLRPHDWINNMGGSIGYGLPVALGAAIACPERRVVALVGDGSAFYTEQALWSMARENCDVTVVIYANRSYAILQGEWRNMGAGTPGQGAKDLLNLDRPEPDWVSIARGHGVNAKRVDTAQALTEALLASYATPGPSLIEAMIG